MRTITLGRKGWIVLGSAVLLITGGIWALQAGYLPEIGRFFAAEPGAPVPITLTALEPDSGPVGTHVIIKGENLPADGRRVPVHFGGGVIDGVSAGWYVEFDLPAEMPAYCPPGAYCILAMVPVRPGSYPVELEAGTACPVYGPDDLPAQPASGEASLECGTVRSNTLAFTVTGEPVASCVPLPRCVYEGSPRCAVDPAPGTVYCPAPSCQPRPPCLDARNLTGPSCEIAEPADGWCPGTPTPTPSSQRILIEFPTAGSTITLGNPPYEIKWRTPASLAPSGPVQIMLFKRALGSGGAFFIARSAPNLGKFNWDASKPVARATDGSPQDLRYILGDDFFIHISVPGTDIWGETGDFSIVGNPPTPPPPPGCYYQEVQCITTPCNPVLACVTPTPTPTRTPTPTPPSGGPVSMQLLPTDGISPVQIGSPRTGNVTVHVDVFMDIPQRTKVSAVDLHVQSDRKLTLSDFSYGPDFPEILRAPQSTPASYTENEFTVALGTGPNGGVSGRVLVGTLTVVVAPGDEPELRMFIRDDSTVTAVDSDTDVLGPVGDLWFITGPRSGRPGDLDGDGDVDIFDYNLVVSNFGKQYFQ